MIEHDEVWFTCDDGDIALLWTPWRPDYGDMSPKGSTASMTLRGKYHSLTAAGLRGLAAACLAAAERMDRENGVTDDAR